jgi:hypothetical protein
MSGPRRDARWGQTFWVLFFAQAKKSTPRAAREPHRKQIAAGDSTEIDIALHKQRKVTRRRAASGIKAFQTVGVADTRTWIPARSMRG